jgi:hypothetical protein
MALPPAAAISLWILACLHGTLHGKPADACRWLQIRSYPYVEMCNPHHNEAIREWIAGIHGISVPAFVEGWRCAPAERDQDP